MNRFTYDNTLNAFLTGEYIYIAVLIVFNEPTLQSMNKVLSNTLITNSVISSLKHYDKNALKV